MWTALHNSRTRPKWLVNYRYLYPQSTCSLLMLDQQFQPEEHALICPMHFTLHLFPPILQTN